jgi:glycosyltransferase involved in cell wall biosynthesis
VNPVTAAAKPSVVFCRSNPIAPDPRVEKAASALADAGYDVTLLGWDRSGTFPTTACLRRMSLHRLPIRARYGTGLHNFPPLLRWQWGLLLWLLRHRRRYDIIHACDFDTVLPALLCKWLLGKRIVYDIFDFYADHLRTTPGWIKMVIRWGDLRVINRVDALILSDESRREQIRGADPRQSTVILNTPPDLRSQFDQRQDPDSTEGLRLVYVGLLQRERGLFDLLHLLAKHPSWQLDLAGFGGDQIQILAQAESLPNLHWHGRVPYQRALALTAAADVVLALYDPALPNHRYASPNKVFEAMMLAKPVVTAQDTHVDRVVEQHRCGLVVPYGQLEALEQVLTRLKDNLALRRELGANGRRAYERYYAWSIMRARLLRLYAQMR